MSALTWQDIAEDVQKDPDNYIDERDRRRLISFTTRMFPEYEAAPHHERIANYLHAIERGTLERLIVVMPPRHGKSTLISEHFPAWFLGRNPDKRIIACSHTSALAEFFSRRARNKITDPRWPFSDVTVAADLAGVQKWDIAGHRGGYVSAGVGGAITGMGADCLVIDDPVKSAAEAESQTYRDAAWEWFTATALTRIEPQGSAVIVGTRWHDDDLIGRVLAAPDAALWTVLHLPAIDEGGHALWPAHYPVDDLEARRIAIGNRNFESLYQGRPSAEAGGTLKRHWWRFWHMPGQPLPPVPMKGPGGTPVFCPVVALPPTFDDSLQSWDMTFKQTTDGSFVVGQAWGKTGANRYLIDQYRAQVDFPDAVLAVKAMTAKWPWILAKLVENKANGPAVVSTLRNNVAGLIEVEPEGGKEARANAASPVVESGNVYLPHPHLAPWVDGFIDECASFPFAKNDDQVDAFSQATIRFNSDEGQAATSYSYLGDDEPSDDLYRRRY